MFACVCVCVRTDLWWVFFFFLISTFFFLNSFPCLFIHSTKTHVPLLCSGLCSLMEAEGLNLGWLLQEGGYDLVSIGPC